MTSRNSLSPANFGPLLERYWQSLTGVISGTIVIGAQFGIGPLKTLQIAYDEGLIGYDNGGWYSCIREETNAYGQITSLDLMDILRLHFPNGEANPIIDWMFDELYNKGSEKFRKFIIDQQTVQFIEQVEELFKQNRHHNNGDATRFKFKTSSELIDAPPPSFLIDGIIIEGGNSYIYGPPGHGKSALVLNMAVSVASGHEWHVGKKVKQGPVIYLTAEGHAGLGKRLEAIQIDSKVNIRDIPLLYVTDVTNLPDQVDDLIVDIEHWTKSPKFGPPVLVIVDTLARHLGAGRNENDASEMGVYVAAVDKISQHFKCHTMSVHHSGKDASKGARGSTALLGAVDTVIKTSKANHRVVVKSEKQRDAEEFEPLAFKFKEVLIPQQNAADIRSFVLEPDTAIPLTAGGAYKPRSKTANAKLRIIKALSDGKPRTYTDIQEIGEADDGSLATAKRAISALVKDGSINQTAGGEYILASNLNVYTV